MMRSSYRRVVLAILCMVGVASTSVAAPGLDEAHPKVVVTTRVYDRLIAAVGDARTPPALRLLPRAGTGGVQIAWYSPQAHTIFLEERAYDLCVRQGADSLASLAVLLGHELAHFYGNHDWAGDFGNGFADLQVGRQLRESHRRRGSEYETEADVFGGYYGYTAGFNTLGVAPRLLGEIYRVFDLGDEMTGYPGLAERQDIARRSQMRLEQLVPVFDAAGHLLVIGEYELAAAAFDWLARDFPSREILNDAGVAFALEALEAMPAGQVRFALPFELDSRTRLRQGHLGQRGQVGTLDHVQGLLRRARDRFDSAWRRDGLYVPALVNLAALDWMEGREHAAFARVTRALALATSADDVRSRAGALIVRGLCRADADSLRAAADFRAALAGAPELARGNLEILAGDRPPAPTSEATGPREIPVGPGSEVYDTILSQPRAIELTGAVLAGGGTPLILYRDLGDRLGFIIDTGERTLVLVATTPGFAGVTARGLALGAAAEDVRQRYGEPTPRVGGGEGVHWLYRRAGSAFRLDTSGRVTAWLRFHTETGAVR